ncbi:ABC transporter [Streptomyces sp. NBC_01387]|uniref:ABC transporter n=1 Tax=unclassified Streptomyces TaxID=2593676 RepID=UPI002024B9B9|nr:MULTISPECIES: ABC transporter [unclassified Streptomyces]MCX4547441.1 ABC transporter [Streptomyces sp. NBC_01500]WSC19164.1 ABC transporter [Streptomyces sp. NBC_01766]WSV53189.1 ABC transporter [Streptomyces sp. NBC_01014]
MTALLRYQAALLLRSQRWLPPVLLYGIFLAVGAQGGDPVLDSLGYAAAALLPATAWLVRICLNQEPAAARDCAAAATSPLRVHLASLGVATGCAALLGCAGTLVITLVSSPTSDDHRVTVPLFPAAVAGLLAVLVCALTGAVAGALFTRPVLHGRGWSIAVTALAALLLLVTRGSPARSAVYGLVSGSRTGTVHVPVLPLVLAVVVAAGVAAGVGALASRRG